MGGPFPQSVAKKPQHLQQVNFLLASPGLDLDGPAPIAGGLARPSAWHGHGRCPLEPTRDPDTAGGDVPPHRATGTAMEEVATADPGAPGRSLGTSPREAPASKSVSQVQLCGPPVSARFGPPSGQPGCSSGRTAVSRRSRAARALGAGPAKRAVPRGSPTSGDSVPSVRGGRR